MGKAAYENARKNGELVEQRLSARANSPYHSHKRNADLDMEAAHLIRWLSKERDSLIDEVERYKHDLAVGVRERMNRADDFLLREGYRPCDIPACNCGLWHKWKSLEDES